MAEPAPSCIAPEIMPASCSDEARPAGSEVARSACSLGLGVGPIGLGSIGLGFGFGLRLTLGLGQARPAR
jgi:hypothetical protein